MKLTQKVDHFTVLESFLNTSCCSQKFPPNKILKRADKIALIIQEKCKLSYKSDMTSVCVFYDLVKVGNLLSLHSLLGILDPFQSC